MSTGNNVFETEVQRLMQGIRNRGPSDHKERKRRSWSRRWLPSPSSPLSLLKPGWQARARIFVQPPWGAKILPQRMLARVSPPKAATPVRRMQKGQLQAGHTTPRIRNGHRASERPPYCHKEFAVASCLNLLARKPSKRYRCQIFVFETFSAVQPGVQPTLPALWTFCD